jgi:hypothetical protein
MESDDYLITLRFIPSHQGRGNEEKKVGYIVFLSDVWSEFDSCLNNAVAPQPFQK